MEKFLTEVGELEKEGKQGKCQVSKREKLEVKATTKGADINKRETTTPTTKMTLLLDITLEEEKEELESNMKSLGAMHVTYGVKVSSQ